ncbi:hypothetical protein D3C80_1289190 [compost metagenome]
MSSKVRLARFSASLMASTGPAPMIRGSIPAAPEDRILAIGLIPSFCSAAAEPMIKAAAPSFTPDALPAVTTPPSNKGLSFCKVVKSELARGCSSASINFGGNLRP